jgi:hypothetical protein
MRKTRRIATNWSIVKDTTAWKIVTNLATSARRIVAYNTGIRISARRAFSFGRKT